MSDLREALESLANQYANGWLSDPLRSKEVAHLIRAILAAHPEPETVTEWAVIERPTMRITGDMDSNVIPVYSESDARHHVKTKPSFYVGVARRVKAGPWQVVE